jgi:uncharacterized protein (DUF2062 family)
MTVKSTQSIKSKAAAWLRQGISPRRLALTLALGFALGCFPVMGIPTAVCALLALALKLNLPAIQAANYAATPLQMLLIVPFVRLGGWLLAWGTGRAVRTSILIHASPLVLISRMTGQALLAWLVFAVPAVTLMTATLTIVLRRIPAVAAADSTN